MPLFRTLFESVPGSFVVLAADLRIVAATDAYLRVTTTRRDDVIGRRLFDVFPANPEDPHAIEVAERVCASLERVRRDGHADALPVQKYDILRRSADGWVFEERYWSSRSEPVLGPDGQRYIIHVAEDVTSFVHAQHLKLDGADLPLDHALGEAAAPDVSRLLSLAEATRRHILEVFRAHRENVSRTARTLGISRLTLRRRLHDYGLRARPDDLPPPRVAEENPLPQADGSL